jgi:type VI secretion system protein ImpA
MAKVESAAPVIDFEALLKPISDESPSGESMVYSPDRIYDQITEARRADKDVPQGEWQTEVKVADFRQVITLAVPALSTQTKDLKICGWLCEALVGQHGFVGLRDGLSLIRQIEENFWDTFHPEIDEGDMEARANAIDWLDKTLYLTIKSIKLTAGPGYNFISWEEAQNFNIPENIESVPYDQQDKMKALKKQAEDEKRITGEMWRSAVAAGNRAFYEGLNLAIEESWNELKALDKTNEEKFDRNQMPSITELSKSLEAIRDVVGKILEDKRLAEPDEADEETAETAEVGEDGEMVMVKKGPAVAVGAIQSRKDALKRLEDIAKYFRETEPHSPVAYLVQRAVKWGNMPLEVWLQDVIKDDNMINNLRQTLGFNTNAPDAAATTETPPQ